MKNLLSVSFAAVAAASGGAAYAEEFGRVISSTPVIQQVGVPRQVCSNQAVVYEAPRSGAGAVIGAIAGGLLGNSIGHGAGRAAATMVGVVGGAAVGDRVEANGATQVQNVQQCATQTYYENRTVAYNVTYEYAGRQYSAQLPQDPGPTLRINVTPAAVSSAPAPDYLAAEGGNNFSQPGYVQPAVVAAPVVQQVVVSPAVVTYPTYAYPSYYYRPYNPPFGVSLNFGYNGSYGRGEHRHHGHWR